MIEECKQHLNLYLNKAHDHSSISLSLNNKETKYLLNRPLEPEANVTQCIRLEALHKCLGNPSQLLPGSYHSFVALLLQQVSAFVGVRKGPSSGFLTFQIFSQFLFVVCPLPGRPKPGLLRDAPSFQRLRFSLAASLCIRPPSPVIPRPPSLLTSACSPLPSASQASPGCHADHNSRCGLTGEHLLEDYFP